MIIVFAGCDCSGKSTCVNMMDKSQWVIKKGVANSDLKKVISSLDFKKDIIYDRIPLIDDFVYSRVFSGKESDFIKSKDEIIGLLKKCTVIYFDCADDVLIQRMKSRGDKYITPDQIPQIKSEYEKTFELLNVNPTRIDTTHASKIEVLNKVIEVIENENC